LEPDHWKPGDPFGYPLVYRPPLYGKQTIPAGSYIQAGYARQPLQQLEELELAASFPASEPIASERLRFTFRRWRAEIQNWQNAGLTGPFIQQLLAKAAPVLMELGFLDLAKRCDSFALFNRMDALLFLSECIQRLDSPEKRSGGHPKSVIGGNAAGGADGRPDGRTPGKTPTKARAGRPKKADKDSAAKVVAALIKHHGYEDNGSVTNYEPATNRGLAADYALSGNALTRFLQDKLGKNGQRQYKAACVNNKIGSYLALWNGDLPGRLAGLMPHESGREGDD
jgi:hypothetical protein